MASNLLWEGIREGCGTCEFWLPFPGNDSALGSCKRFPPTMVPMTRKDSWGDLICELDQVLPTMTVSDWCGEYRRKNSQVPDACKS